MLIFSKKLYKIIIFTNFIMEKVFNLYKESLEEDCVGQDKLAREILDYTSITSP